MLVSYPKIVFLWPAYVVSIVAGVYMHFAAGSAQEITAAGTGAIAVGWTFLIMLSLNLVVLSFDFPRTTSLTLFFVIVATVLGGALAVVYFPNFLPSLSGLLASIQPQANATFYYIFAGVMTLIYVGVLLNRRFDYWEVRPNELLHHHGVLSDLERFSSPHLKIEKEINDIFEYLLLGSGRLILNPSNEKRSIVLDNVLWISQKESKITKLLSALQVQVREQD
ncbi:MAG: hypothetical protein KDA75_16675 [Planctomycetaceae bacterium]|nr:hypothetical protein [Planctomycetaceae bacterium]